MPWKAAVHSETMQYIKIFSTFFAIQAATVLHIAKENFRFK